MSSTPRRARSAGRRRGLEQAGAASNTYGDFGVGPTRVTPNEVPFGELFSGLASSFTPRASSDASWSTGDIGRRASRRVLSIGTRLALPIVVSPVVARQARFLTVDQRRDVEKVGATDPVAQPASREARTWDVAEGGLGLSMGARF